MNTPDSRVLISYLFAADIEGFEYIPARLLDAKLWKVFILSFMNGIASWEQLKPRRGTNSLPSYLASTISSFPDSSKSEK